MDKQVYPSLKAETSLKWRRDGDVCVGILLLLLRGKNSSLNNRVNRERFTNKEILAEICPRIGNVNYNRTEHD